MIRLGEFQILYFCLLVCTSWAAVTHRISSINTRGLGITTTHTEVVDNSFGSKLRITCLTIGTRGDVQPFIALSQGLQEFGHTCTIATHLEFKGMIENAGLKFKDIGGSPAELLKHCLENPFFSLTFFTQGLERFSGWIKTLLPAAKNACKDADLIIESPTAMVGRHIAESMKIPYLRAFTMPWTTTKYYPQAFAASSIDTRNWWFDFLRSFFNYASYPMFDYVFWKGIKGYVNEWRVKELNLPATNFWKLRQKELPILYNFSESVVERPKDWDKSVYITGYWFVDLAKGSEGKTSNEDVPENVKRFIKKAKSQEKKVVYIGFGSVDVPDAENVFEAIEKAVASAKVWAIISRAPGQKLATPGPSMRQKQVTAVPSALQEKKAFNVAPPISQQKKYVTAVAPSSQEKEAIGPILYIQSISHERLFPLIDAAFHHGGAGTTGASIKAGIPTLIKPFLGDQYFWAERVETLKIGKFIKTFEVSELERAFRAATTEGEMKHRSKVIGQEVQAEDGVGKAIAIIREVGSFSS
ncbi:hypothetical protein O181_011407 [Austropuccinia psidii MF-1]|uniref:Glycosyltransferase family 28 N-terminal domain-containing protein n=1 Tax=Austropuccinia psidii MF-1 TaxID=1389203 RepID=A0A9Q3BVN5_9BASI|nr:hypothetical protein [Austropuccinia psidii MF-1]